MNFDVWFCSVGFSKYATENFDAINRLTYGYATVRPEGQKQIHIPRVFFNWVLCDVNVISGVCLFLISRSMDSGVYVFNWFLSLMPGFPASLFHGVALFMWLISSFVSTPYHNVFGAWSVWSA